MKTKFSIFALLIVSCITARAQGVIHLGTGDSHLFSQPALVGFQVIESGSFFVVQLLYTGDLFTLGDSLQVDVLSTPTSTTPLATSIATNPPATSETGITFSWPGGPWDASQGAVRLTMLSGSVDISSVKAITGYNFSERFYSYTIPEPDSSSLLLFSGAVLGGARWFARRKKRVI